MTQKRQPTNQKAHKGKPVPTLVDHKPAAQLQAGEDARRLEYQEFCFGLHIRGWSYRDIAKELEEHYFLPTTPSHPTVMAYIRGAVTHRKESIADLRDAYLAVTLPRLEELIKNFLPIATGKGPKQVIRYKTVDGTPLEVIDEDGFEEARKAAEVVVKVAEQARKILGVGIDEKGKDTAKVTDARVSALIFQTVNNNFTGEGAIKTVGCVSLTSGDPGIDALEDAGGSI